MSMVAVLHNPRAGLPGFASQVEAVAEALARDGVAVGLERRANIDGLRQAAREAAAAGAQAVLVAGGDGTVGTIAGELAGSTTSLGVLPAGTANVLARTLGLPLPGPLEPQAKLRAARMQLEAPAQLTDLGRAGRQSFIMWAGMGLDALATQAFEDQRQRSRHFGAYAYAVLLTFWTARDWHGLDLRLRASGPAGAREVRGHFLMATVGQTGYHGGGLFKFTDDFRLDDGLMDLFAFEGRTYADGLALAARVFASGHLGQPGAHRLTGDRFEFEPALPQPTQVDAEPKPATPRFEVTVLPRRLRLLVPRAAAARLYLDPRS
jgi:diacylglycerol kinase family enzyme